jgi:FkbM family methyltransferase
VNKYEIKRRMLRPVTAWRRHRAGALGPYKRAVLEAHDYRPAVNQFFGAARQNPRLLYDIDLHDGAVMVDVGGYEGEWSGQILARAETQGARAVDLHVFEPEPNSLERLQRALGEDGRVHLHPFGLASCDRFQRMAVGGPGTSQFKSGSQPGFFGAADLELRDVNTVVTRLGIDHIDVMMINIEGGEYELIDRLYETDWLPRIDCLLVQFHEFGPDAYRARRRNRRELAESHRCTWSYKWVFERWDRRVSSH